MTTPPGWYPDPGHTGGGPALERWWDGSGWTDHTRQAQAAAPAAAAPPGGFGGMAGFGPPEPPDLPPYDIRDRPPSPGASRGTKLAVLVTAAVVLVAAIAGGIVLLDDGDGSGTASSPGPGLSASPAPTTPSPSLPDGGDGSPEASPDDSPDGGGGLPPESGDRAMDAVNGIYLPVPEGWEGRSGANGAGLTTGPYPCPGDKKLKCVRGGVNSQAAEGHKATTAKGVAEEDIAKNAEASYGKSPSSGSDAYGGITSRKEVKSEPVTVAGEQGHLVRWKLSTAEGAGGYVQSVAFPSPLDPEKFVVIRFGFDAGEKAPDLSEMDAITAGVEPLTAPGGTAGREV
ncbi:DUF2510 domain-containing protein [Streptomyces xinghaiensis]|uniref:DUF2510 domain-containing protein n=1 Tax=Streptomyces xinghaiensis TaxID=1038928 RepID=UPI002E132575|nr:DUF2510 domain-containing protein [Streptomyces xinghaiensis]